MNYAKDQRQATSNLGDLLIEKMMTLQEPVSGDGKESDSDK